jgi:hypothetical protein
MAGLPEPKWLRRHASAGVSMSLRCAEAKNTAHAPRPQAQPGISDIAPKKPRTVGWCLGRKGSEGHRAQETFFVVGECCGPRADRGRDWDIAAAASYALGITQDRNMCCPQKGARSCTRLADESTPFRKSTMKLGRVDSPPTGICSQDSGYSVGPIGQKYRYECGSTSSPRTDSTGHRSY